MKRIGLILTCISLLSCQYNALEEKINLDDYEVFSSKIESDLENIDQMVKNSGKSEITLDVLSDFAEEYYGKDTRAY